MLLQGMEGLPTSMTMRFWFYLNVLPVVQDVSTYFLLFVSIILMIASIHKILLYQPKESTSTRQWLDSDVKSHTMQFINSRRPSYKNKEMDTYYNSLLDSHDAKEVCELTMGLSSLQEDVVWSTGTGKGYSDFKAVAVVSNWQSKSLSITGRNAPLFIYIKIFKSSSS